MITRQAIPEDVPWMLSELERFSVFYGSKHPLFPDAAESETTLRAIIEGDLVLVAEERDEPRGFLAASLTLHPYNSKIRVLSAMLWWVPPEHRGGRAAHALFTAFQSYGRRCADWIVMTITKDTLINTTTLEKRGYQLREASFLLEVSV